MKKYLVFFALLISFILNEGSVALVAAVVVPPDPIAVTGMPVRVIDGTDTDTTVDISYFNLFPGFEFGQGLGAGFTELVSGSSLTPGVYDFSVKNTGTSDTFALSGGLATETFSGFNGNSPHGPAYKNLSLLWTFPSGFSMELLTTLSGGAASGEGMAPVPIPSSIYLMGIGLIGLFGLSRRRTQE